MWNDDNVFTKLNELALAKSDVVNYHKYENPSVHLKLIRDLQKYGRPLICMEYMARKRGSTFESILPKLKKENVITINWGLVDGKTQTKYAWDEKQWGSGAPALWFHDIFRKDATPYLQSETEPIKKLTREK